MNFQNFTSSHPVLRLGLLAVCLLLGGRAMTQPAFPLPVDVLHGFGNGQVGIVHSPIDIGRIENAFDGIMTPLNLARSAGANPMVVTLLFAYEFNLSATGVYASNVESGVWSVEAAQTLAELDGHSGTYQKLIDQAPYGPHQLAAQAVAATGRVLRLTMHRQTGDNYVHLGEWTIAATTNVQPAGLCMRPNEVRLIPNASFQPAWVVADLAGHEFPLPAASVSFTSSDPAVVSVDPAGIFASGAATGESTVTAAWNGVELQTEVKVVGDFVSPPAEKRVARVAMIIIDPPIPAAGGQRFSELFWAYNGGPMALAQQTRDSMFAVSGGTVDYQFVEIHDEPELLTRFGGTLLTVDSMYRLFQEPGWTTLHHVAEVLGQSQFLYNDLLDKYDLCEKSNAHQIDEVWVWAMPFIGMYESNMAGANAFWINGAPVTGNACTDLLPIMGFNYERYAGCALHNFTHRIETTMYRAYNTSVRYVPSDPPFPPGRPLDPLQTFMLYDALEPGNAHVGNSHFPPNGVDNYDYDNLNVVPTHAPNWKRYPYLFDQTEPVNCSAWGCEGDCGLNYTSWWMRHIPHFRCKDKAGVLNNWWTYIIDYNEGKALEAATDDCDCAMFDDAVADCDSKGEFPWHDWIARVTLHDLDNPSGKSQYSDFTGQTAHLQAGQSYSLALTAGFSYFTYDEYFRVWIDWNDDGLFDDVEKVAEGVLPRPADGQPQATLTLTNALSVPASAATAQNLKMRVSMKRGGYPTPCETIPFGEVEDYSVAIQGPGPAQPNLQVFNWTLIGSALPGETRNSTFDLVNAGSVAVSGSFLAGIFLSTDNVWGPNDPLLAALPYAGLPVGTLAGQSLPFTIPANTVPGDYFVILRADIAGQVAESNESDNQAVGTFTVLPSPGGAYCNSKGDFPWHDWIARVKLTDLDHASGKSSYSDFTGQTVNVNAGVPVGITLETGFSYFTYEEYWKVWIDYNGNGVFEEPAETVIAVAAQKPADGTPFYAVNTTAFILGGFTQDVTTRMRVAMKRGSFPTPCETFAFGEVEDYTIHIAPGGGQSRPDLSLTNFLAVGSGMQGSVVPFTFDLVNNGTAPAAGSYAIGAYLSTNPQLDAGDPLVGTVMTGNTPIGAIPSVQGAMAIPPNLAPGQYFFILKADLNNAVIELDELNNLTSRPFLVIPAAGGSGADLEVALTADHTTVPVYGYVTFTLTARNAGSQAVQTARITVGVCAPGASLGFSQSSGLVYAGTPPAPTFGTFNFVAQEWTLASLAPGQTALLTLPLFTLTGAERRVVAFASAQSPGDPDSQPGSVPANCTPAQDDEAVWTINAGQQALRPADRRAVDGGIYVFPNPAMDRISVFMEKWQGRPAVVSMYNPMGVEVLRENLDEVPAAPHAIDLSALPNGAYSLKMETPGEAAVVVKVVVMQRY